MCVCVRERERERERSGQARPNAILENQPLLPRGLALKRWKPPKNKSQKNPRIAIYAKWPVYLLGGIYVCNAKLEHADCYGTTEGILAFYTSVDEMAGMHSVARAKSS